ncbi:hypothetical protein LXA43DRAFT_1002524 [Ganoderma leucocontextum]|nr:hypothetical protein LXA43DRAFT_1002524 [Ganoderma leucocontextum]
MRMPVTSRSERLDVTMSRSMFNTFALTLAPLWPSSMAQLSTFISGSGANVPFNPSVSRSYKILTPTNSKYSEQRGTLRKLEVL